MPSCRSLWPKSSLNKFHNFNYVLLTNKLFPPNYVALFILIKTQLCDRTLQRFSTKLDSLIKILFGLYNLRLYHGLIVTNDSCGLKGLFSLFMGCVFIIRLLFPTLHFLFKRSSLIKCSSYIVQNINLFRKMVFLINIV